MSNAIAGKTIEQARGQACYIDRRFETSFIPFPKCGSRKGLLPPMTPAIDSFRAQRAGDLFAKLEESLSGQAMCEYRSQNDDRAQINAPSKEPHGKRSNSFSATIFGTAETPALVVIRSKIGWPAPGLARVVGPVASPSASGASGLLCLIRQNVIESGKSQKENGIRQQSAVQYTPPWSWSTEEVTPSRVLVKLREGVSFFSRNDHDQNLRPSHHLS